MSIDSERVTLALHRLDAKDHGAKLLREWIFYDSELTWLLNGRVLRVRDDGSRCVLTLKERLPGIKFPHETEVCVSSRDSCIELLEALQFRLYRYQEKRRHTMSLDGIEYAFDTWPDFPTYLEIERLRSDAPSLATAASRISLDVSIADFTDARDALGRAGLNLDDFVELTFQRRVRRE